MLHIHIQVVRKRPFAALRRCETRDRGSRPGRSENRAKWSFAPASHEIE
jgi:hypothetical protein